jgi:hypothetical protein
MDGAIAPVNRNVFITFIGIHPVCHSTASKDSLNNDVIAVM